MNARITAGLAGLIAALTAFGCAADGGEFFELFANGGAKPCVVSAPKMSIGESAGNFAIAGIVFDAINCSNKEISEIEAVMFCTNSSGEPAELAGGNPVLARAEISLAPGERKTLALSLDAKLNSIPEENWTIDPCEIVRVSFSDGSSWRDRSLFAIGGED